MKEITLTKEQYDRLPYRTTEKTKDATFGEIVGLLRTHGIRKYFMDEGEDPETCNMGGYAPGTEECDFCASSEYCAEAFHEMLKKANHE